MRKNIGFACIVVVASWLCTLQAKEAAKDAGPAAVAHRSLLFDGRTLTGWKEVDFGGHGEVRIKPGGVLEIGAGDMLTGLVYTNRPIRMNYELSLEARRTAGDDFFCGLTFPVGTNCCTLIIGGWGGSLIGLSSVDGMDASENETGDTFRFEQNRWYAIRLRVTTEKIEAWLGDRRFVNLDTTERKLGMRAGEIEACMPLGLATWKTTGELRNIQMLKVDAVPVQ